MIRVLQRSLAVLECFSDEKPRTVAAGNLAGDLAAENHDVPDSRDIGRRRLSYPSR